MRANCVLVRLRILVAKVRPVGRMSLEPCWSFGAYRERLESRGNDYNN